MDDRLDAAIVGAGPSGIAAAIQLRRSGVEFALFEQAEIGGLLLNAHLVENYPGFPKGISGTDLVQRFRQQLERWEIPVVRDCVRLVEYKDEAFRLAAGSGEITCRFLMIASGTVALRLPAAIIREGAEDRIFYEVFPLRDIRGRHLGIVGAGDAAFDYGLQLAEHNRVTIICRDSGPCCLPLLAERAEAVDGLDVLKGTQLLAVDAAGEGLLLNLAGEEEPQGRMLEADYLLAAVGREPALGFLGPGLEKARDEVRRDGRLFLIGDVENHLYRQAGICVGDGIRAAMQICEMLRQARP